MKASVGSERTVYLLLFNVFVLMFLICCFTESDIWQSHNLLSKHSQTPAET